MANGYKSTTRIERPRSKNGKWTIVKITVAGNALIKSVGKGDSLAAARKDALQREISRFRRMGLVHPDDYVQSEMQM